MKKVLAFALATATLLAGCNQVAEFGACDNQFPKIVAHRGASYYAPENTVAAFELAWKQGADAIEADYYLTADGHIVCIHDRNTKRVSGVDLRVEDATFKQLRELEVGSWKDPEFEGLSIPTMAETLKLVRPGGKIYLDIKSGPEIVEPMAEVIRASGLNPEQVVVIAFNADVIEKTRKVLPELKAYWLTSYRYNEETKQWSPSLEQILQTLERIDAHGLNTRALKEVIDEDFVKALRENGYEFHAWTINDADLARRFHELGVDSITTDRPAYIRQALKFDAE